jgi:hypothetical protein
MSYCTVAVWHRGSGGNATWHWPSQNLYLTKAALELSLGTEAALLLILSAKAGLELLPGTETVLEMS